MASEHLPGYGKRQEVAAAKLGITVRSMRWLVRQLREVETRSVMRRSRSDRGLGRISQEWQKFIVET